ncbi:MAG: hypothetical protein NVS1B13_03610 [Flavisolibacter sp.]
MKKILGVLAIAVSLVACNNSGESSTSTDSTKSVNSTTTTVDSSKMGMDSTHKMVTDSTKK